MEPPSASGDVQTPRDPDPAFETVASEVERAIDARGWRGSEWGVLAVSVENGDTLVSRNVGNPLIPASNVKVFTSAAALFHLGADFRFPTFALTDGSVADGTVAGDLVLYGTGDPALSDRFHDSELEPFEELARQLADNGIQRIRGDVVGDGSFFSGPMIPDTWDDAHLTASYGAPASALSAGENLVTLRIGPADEPGEPPVVETEPEGAELDLNVEATTVARAPSRPLTVERSDRHEPIQIKGEIHTQARDQWRRIPVVNPPLFAASLFRNTLEEEGIEVDGGVRSDDGQDGGGHLARGSVHAPAWGEEAGANVLAVRHSPPLRELLPMVNERSSNLYAELFVQAVGQVAAGEGSVEAGTREVERYLVERAGVASDAFNVVDGSGLSRENRASASAMIEILRHMDRQEHADVFWESMPVAAESARLRRMTGTAAAGNLQAKTGTIRQVSALSGRVETADGERVYFSILANQVPSSRGAKDVEDAIGGRLAEFRRENGLVQTAGERDGAPGSPEGATRR